MTTSDDLASHLDRARLRELFNLQGSNYEARGGNFDLDLYPAFRRLRETGPVHEGVVGPLVGYTGDAFFAGLPYPDRQHFSAFDFETCDTIFRSDVFATDWHRLDGTSISLPLLFQDGDDHRRYRQLVQPSFVAKKARWWIENWVSACVDALIQMIDESGDTADLNLDMFAAIPLLTICGSFGVGVRDALDIRAAVTSDGRGVETFLTVVSPIITARRADPQDDLISVLTQAHLEEDGHHQELSDADIMGFAYLLLAAGSGTTWKQMGITMLALLWHPDWLETVKQDPAKLRPVIEESLRWMPTDPMFSRWATREVELGGVTIPEGAIVHACLGAGHRDPKRWSNPDDFDPGRPLQSHLGFGNGAHICLGMHLARAEITVAISRLLERFPNLRPDPDAPAAKITGMYERGPTAVPVLLR